MSSETPLLKSFLELLWTDSLPYSLGWRIQGSASSKRRGYYVSAFVSALRFLSRSRLLDTTTKDRRAGIASKFVERGAVDSRSAENQVIGLYLYSMVGLGAGWL